MSCYSSEEELMKRKRTSPSTKREGFSAIPTVKWEDVGALDSIQKMMDFFISRRIKHPEDYEVT